MLEYKSGDILKDKSDAIVNTVNCVGVMGRGLVLQFKKAFPDNYNAYVAACKKGEVQPGRMFVFETNRLIPPYYIINFPTKRHWRTKSRMEDIEAGLQALVDVIRNRNIKSIAIPPLGSGLGGLDWSKVKLRIESKLNCIHDVQVNIYEPEGAPVSDKMVHHRETPKLTTSRATLVGLIQQYLDGLLDPYATLLEVHKLMYFMQEAGEPLKLRFKEAPYGPYAENLRHVLHTIEGYFISGYADGGDTPNKQLNIVPGAFEEAKKILDQCKETQDRFNKVSSLIEGFESPAGLELLSTVHWIINNKSVKGINDIISYTHKWGKHKKQFTKRQISIATNRLLHKGWVRDFIMET